MNDIHMNRVIFHGLAAIVVRGALSRPTMIALDEDIGALGSDVLDKLLGRPVVYVPSIPVDLAARRYKDHLFPVRKVDDRIDYVLSHRPDVKPHYKYHSNYSFIMYAVGPRESVVLIL